MDFLWSIMYPERTITGSWWSEYAEFDDILGLVTSGQVDLNSLITHHFPLKEINAAFQTFVDKERTGCIKAIIHP